MRISKGSAGGTSDASLARVTVNTTGSEALVDSAPAGSVAVLMMTEKEAAWCR